MEYGNQIELIDNNLYSSSNSSSYVNEKDLSDILSENNALPESGASTEVLIIGPNQKHNYMKKFKSIGK